jgi:hypothetical protein
VQERQNNNMKPEQEETTRQQIVNSNIVNIDTSSSTDTSTSSYDTPEVSATGRPPLNRGRKSKQQEAQIAELQAMLLQREEDFQLLQQHVLAIMTQESLTHPFPTTPTYVEVGGKAVTKLHLLQNEMLEKEKEFRATLQYLEAQRKGPPRITLETPGPHSLQAKSPRPEDLLNQQKLRVQATAEETLAQQTVTPSHTPTTDPNQHLVDVFKQLTRVMKDSNTSDATDPSPFSGSDEKWDEFYTQLRTYLAAKNWLTTFEDPTGPGAPGFDNEINRKIYNKLLMLCKAGHAVTYVKKAAEFDGHGAGHQLLLRYDGFSKQRQKSLKKTTEQLRHVNGTNMSKHIDLFEKICGQLAHNNPSDPPTEEQRIDWFLETVHERTYDSVHASCVDAHLEGKLTFAKLVKMYTHQCFHRYPHFQLSEIDPKLDISNNVNSLHGGGGGKAKEETDETKETEGRNSAIATTTTETGRLLETGPNRKKEKARIAKKTKEEE